MGAFSNRMSFDTVWAGGSPCQACLSIVSRLLLCDLKTWEQSRGRGGDVFVLNGSEMKEDVTPGWAAWHALSSV